MIRLKYRYFNPIYYYVRELLSNADIRTILVYGGSSAGKTHSIGQALSIHSLFNNYNVIAFRKEQANIQDTIKSEFIAGIENCYLSPLFQNQRFRIINQNENFIRFRGVDKEGKIKGLKGFKKLYLDELDQFLLNDWEQAQLRLRGEDNQQIIASWNPVDKRHWIKKEIIDKDIWEDCEIEIKDVPKKYTELAENSFIKINKSGDTVLIRTTYRDNKWIVGADGYGRFDKHVINTFEKLKTTNPIKYEVYANGNWGKEEDGMKFVTTSYRKEYRPITDVGYIVLSFDNNYNPLVCQVIHCNYDFTAVNFYATIKQYNTDIHTFLPYLELKLNELIPGLNVRSLIITGDPNANQKNVYSKGNISMFQSILDYFRLSESQFELVSHISHDNHRTKFNNTLFSHQNIVVNPSNTDLIFDFENVKMKEVWNGEKKSLKIDKDRRTTSAEADSLDCARYFMQAFLYEIYG